MSECKAPLRKQTSGDLTQRMITPAIFRLARRGLLSPEFRLIGYARTKMTDDEFRARMCKAVMRETKDGDEAAWAMTGATLNGGIMGSGIVGGFSWMWIPTLLALGIEILLGWAVIGKK